MLITSISEGFRLRVLAYAVQGIAIKARVLRPLFSPNELYFVMFAISRHFKSFWVAFISIVAFVEFPTKRVTVSSRSKDYFLVLLSSKYERSFNLEAFSDVKISHSLFRDLF